MFEQRNLNGSYKVGIIADNVRELPTEMLVSIVFSAR
jgi:hypothetical protein